MRVLITGGETATKFNNFFHESESKPLNIPANVCHTAHLQWANSPGKWKEQDEKFLLSVHHL